MRAFRVEGDWILDEFGWRVGRVVTETVPLITGKQAGEHHTSMFKYIEFFDDRFAASGENVYARMPPDVQVKVGSIKLSKDPPDSPCPAHGSPDRPEQPKTSEYAKGFMVGAQTMMKVVKIDKGLSDSEEMRLLQLLADSLTAFSKKN